MVFVDCSPCHVTRLTVYSTGGSWWIDDCLLSRSFLIDSSYLFPSASVPHYNDMEKITLTPQFPTVRAQLEWVSLVCVWSIIILVLIVLWSVWRLIQSEWHHVSLSSLLSPLSLPPCQVSDSPSVMPDNVRPGQPPGLSHHITISKLCESLHSEIPSDFLLYHPVQLVNWY